MQVGKMNFTGLFSSIIIIGFFTLLVNFGCSNPNSTPENSKPVDSMNADISGSIDFKFKSTTVNALTIPKDSSQIIQMSGTYVKGPFEIYTIYFAFLDDGSGTKQFSLDSTETFTRFEYVLGATTAKVIYGRNLTGNLTLTQITKTTLSGTFNFRATEILDTTKYIEIKNGIFYYTTDN